MLGDINQPARPFCKAPKLPSTAAPLPGPIPTHVVPLDEALALAQIRLHVRGRQDRVEQRHDVKCPSLRRLGKYQQTGGEKEGGLTGGEARLGSHGTRPALVRKSGCSYNLQGGSGWVQGSELQAGVWSICLVNQPPPLSEVGGCNGCFCLGGWAPLLGVPPHPLPQHFLFWASFSGL